MKKFLAFLFALCLLLTLAACEKDAPTTDAPSVPTTQPTEKPTEPSTAPTAPTTIPTEPTTVPTEPTTVPTEPTTVPTEPVHVHTPGEWIVNLESHHQVCTDCGEALNEGAHVLKDIYCTECVAEIYSDEYGSSVYLYDFWGNSIFALEYDTDGSLLYTYTWEYTYDADGNMLTMAEYCDGNISYEAEYGLDADGRSFTLKDTIYYEDGSKDYSEYDAYGSAIVTIYYNADGAITYNARFEYVYSDEGLILGQKTYENDILVSECEYAVIEDADGYYTYCSKDILYYEDGSKLITKYNEYYEVINETYLDTNGNAIDNSSKFNAEICAPLFGTWESEMTLDEELMGMVGIEGMEGLSVKVSFTFTFTAEGQMIAKIAIHPDSMVDYMTEYLYSMYELEYGMTRDEADAALQQQTGMTVAEYAALALSSGEMADQLQQELEMVYYVEGNQIYAGNSWTSKMEPQEFTLTGDTLTLIMTDENDAELTYELVMKKSESQNSLFNSETCAPLFGTWSNDVIMPGELLGMSSDIRANVTMSFSDQGVRTTVILLNREDFAAAFKELYYTTYESYGMTRSEVDALILSETGMTMDAFVDYYLETDEGKAVMNQYGSDLYYVEDNILYCVESGSDDIAVIPFVIEGDTLTVTVSDPEFTYTLIKTAN